jgi:hypothetical protein
LKITFKSNSKSLKYTGSKNRFLTGKFMIAEADAEGKT